MAAAVGIPPSHVFAGVRPAGKKEVVQRLQGEGRRVVMVGDGFNDTAALAQADVGMAMGSSLSPASEASPPPAPFLLRFPRSNLRVSATSPNY